MKRSIHHSRTHKKIDDLSEKINLQTTSKNQTEKQRQITITVNYKCFSYIFTD